MKKILFFLVLFTFILSGFSSFEKVESENKKVSIEKNIKSEEGANNVKKFHYSYFNKKELYDYVGFGSDLPEISGKKIYGGIVPHHLFAVKDISNFFFNIKKTNPKTIVLIGPNHREIGNGDILVSKFGYKTPWGDVLPDEEKILKILDTGIAGNDESAFEGEHSISSLVSYIKFFMPETKIIPIIIKTKTKSEDLDKLSRELSKILEDDDFVLASVDFSHYLNRFASQFHDDKTVSVIKNFDFETLKKVEADSPNSLRVLMQYLKEKGAENLAYYKNTNSALYSGALDQEGVTSYLFALFSEGEPENNEIISILSFGDTMFDRGIKKIMDKGKEPFEFLRGEENKFIKGYDFGMLNLEGPITRSENGQNKEFNFKFEPKIAGLLKDNGFNILNLANNHSYDYFKIGLEDTRNNLIEQGIDYFGGMKIEDSYKTKIVGDKKIAFVGIDETTRPVKITDFYPLIKKLKTENNFVVVNIHWGYEYDKLPSEIQKDIGHNLIDNGADVIFGHHPHVIQPMEIYKDGVIFYSLGNFIFDQPMTDAKKGIGVGTILEKEKKTFYIFPIDIVAGQPKPLNYSDGFKFCETFLSDIKVIDKDACSFKLER